MQYQFTTEDILKAGEVYLYNEETLYIVDENREAYGFYKYGSAWFHKENFWDYFESSLMLSYFRPITKQEAVGIYHAWLKS